MARRAARETLKARGAQPAYFIVETIFGPTNFANHTNGEGLATIEALTERMKVETIASASIREISAIRRHSIPGFSVSLPNNEQLFDDNVPPLQGSDFFLHKTQGVALG